MKLNELTIAKAGLGIRKREFSVSELFSDCLSKIQTKNDTLHAYLSVFKDSATEAKRLDNVISKMNESERNALPPLFGIPLAIKDNILIKEKRATAGSKMLETYTARYDAAAIRMLKNNKALFLGKTNLDEFAMGSSTENSAYGPTRNAHDTSRVPGGSSGGSASAVAGDMCLGALGSDTGGSIRQPASFSGIVGFKPTYGEISRHGLIAMASSLDQIGPMTKTVEDAVLLFNAIRGNDVFDSTSNQSAIRESKSNEKSKTVRGLRVGIPKEYFNEGLDADVKEKIVASIKKISAAGAIITEVSLPHSIYALPAYYIIVPSEVSANMARYDGIRYGQQNISDAGQPQNLYDVYATTRKKFLGQEVKRRILLGTYALSAGYYDAYYLRAQKVRTLIAADFRNAFQNVDVIAGPTTPTPAFKLGERTKNPLQMYLADIYTVAINLSGLPGISLPSGSVARDGKNLPIGIQLIGPHQSDDALLTIAGLIESIIA